MARARKHVWMLFVVMVRDFHLYASMACGGIDIRTLSLSHVAAADSSMCSSKPTNRSGRRHACTYIHGSGTQVTKREPLKAHTAHAPHETPNSSFTTMPTYLHLPTHTNMEGRPRPIVAYMEGRPHTTRQHACTHMHTYMEGRPKVTEAPGEDAPSLGGDEGNVVGVRDAVDAELLGEGLVAEADDAEPGVFGLRA
jgi:hypothetical protein